MPARVATTHKHSLHDVFLPSALRINAPRYDAFRHSHRFFSLYFFIFLPLRAASDRLWRLLFVSSRYSAIDMEREELTSARYDLPLLRRSCLLLAATRVATVITLTANAHIGEQYSRCCYRTRDRPPSIRSVRRRHSCARLHIF